MITHTLTDANLPGLAYESLARLLHAKFGNAGELIDPSYRPPQFVAGMKDEDDIGLLSLVSDSLDSYLRDHRQDESNIVIEARGDQAAAKRSTTRWMAVSAR